MVSKNNFHRSVKIFYGFLIVFFMAILLVSLAYFGASKSTVSKASFDQVNYVQNGSFEQWNNGLPNNWKGTNIGKDQNSSDGQYAVKLTGGANLLQGKSNIDFAKTGNIGQRLEVIDINSKNKIGNKIVIEIPGSISQTLIGLKSDTKYQLTFKAKGGAGVATIEYSYDKREANLFKLPKIISEVQAAYGKPKCSCAPFRVGHSSYSVDKCPLMWYNENTCWIDNSFTKIGNNYYQDYSYGFTIEKDSKGSFCAINFYDCDGTALKKSTPTPTTKSSDPNPIVKVKKNQNFGPTSDYQDVIVKFTTKKGLKNKAVTVTFSANSDKAVFLDEVKLFEESL